MRRAWFNTVTAFGLAAASASPAMASPAAMPISSRPSGNSTAPAATGESTGWTESLKFWKSEPQPQPVTAARPLPVTPVEEVSPWRHPIQYMSASVSDSSIVQRWKKDAALKQAPQNTDRLSLNTPTGPATPQFHIAAAQLAERQGKIPDARRQLQQGLKKWPNDVELLRAAARMEDRQGQLPLAESLYTRALTANPQQAGVLNDLGLCLARQGKLQQSVQTLEQAIHLQPEKALYRNNAATVLVEMRQDQRALAHLSAVHDPAVSNFNLGKLLVDRGRTHEAMLYLRTAVEIDPTMQSAHDAIAQINGTNSYGQAVIPDMQPQHGQPTFPATARGPALNSSSRIEVPRQMMPATQAPTTTDSPSAPLYQTAAAPGYQTTAAPVYQTTAAPVDHSATSPRYLPPVPPAVPATMYR